MPMARLVVAVLFDRVDLLDVTGPPEVFALVKRVTGNDSYRVVIAAPAVEPVMTSAGVRIMPDIALAELAGAPIDTLIVPGAVTVDSSGRGTPMVPDEVVSKVAELAKQARRIASVCVGAHVLAAAGVLTGKRATTHWSTAQQLAADHPDIEVDADPIFIRDGDVWTGAGISSCLDLSLALVADDLGEQIAQRVARHLVVYLKRPGGQSQFSVPLEPLSATRRIADLRHYILQNVTRPLTVPELAAHVQVGERQLTRIFHTELGMTPGAYVETARVEAARRRLESSDDTLSRVAVVSGFGSVDSLHRAFRRVLNITPTEYRRRFRLPDRERASGPGA